MAAWDLANFVIEDTSEAIKKKGRTGGTGDRFAALKGTPFEEWVKKTFDAGKASRLTVPTEADAKKARRLLRLAAEKQGLGVRIPEPFGRTEDGKYLVLFQGQTRVARKFSPKPRKPRKDETPEAFRTRVEAWVKETGKTWTPPKEKPAKDAPKPDAPKPGPTK